MPLVHGPWYVLRQINGLLRGTLSGLRQHNDKAEIQAIKQASGHLQWTIPGRSSFGVTVHVGHQGLHRLLQDPHDLPEDQGDGLMGGDTRATSWKSWTSLLVQHIAAHRAGWRER